MCSNWLSLSHTVLSCWQPYELASRGSLSLKCCSGPLSLTGRRTAWRRGECEDYLPPRQDSSHSGRVLCTPVYEEMSGKHNLYLFWVMRNRAFSCTLISSTCTRQ